MAKKKKQAKEVAKVITPEEKEAALIKTLNEAFTVIAKRVIEEVGPLKCFIIIQDDAGHGVSMASKHFTHHEFMQYADIIAKTQKVNL